MDDWLAHLTIIPALDAMSGRLSAPFYADAVRAALKQLLLRNVIDSPNGEPLFGAERLRWFKMQLPLMHCSKPGQPPFDMSFFVLSSYRASSFKFFFEMISRWLVPGRRLNVVLLFAADFRISEIGPELFTLCEVMVRVESEEERDLLLRHLPTVEAEVRLGMGSAYFARRILEMRGLTADEKTAQIHEHIASLIKRAPKVFDNTLFEEMQHLLVTCKDEFKDERSATHLSRLIGVRHLFRKELQSLATTAPRKRHLLIKLQKVSLLGSRSVLGVMIGVRFLRDMERLEERQLIKALQSYLTAMRVVEGSYIIQRRSHELTATLYLEVESEGGAPFSLEEIKQLRRHLPAELKRRIEHPMHPLFNPRNEEEIFRNTLALANQLCLVRDLPQVFISFDEQTVNQLTFAVILVRVLRDDCPLQELIRRAACQFEFIQERQRQVGLVRRRYPKEATVFRVRMDKEPFLRLDHSLDIFKARQFVVAELTRAVGEMRDYNGGMLSKQHELLEALRKLLEEEGLVPHYLVDNFFHSLSPSIMRSLMEPHALKVLYQLMHAALDAGLLSFRAESVTFQEDQEFVYAAVLLDDLETRERLSTAIQELDLAPTSLVTASIMADLSCIGYIYRTDQSSRRMAFKEALLCSLGNSSSHRNASLLTPDSYPEISLG